MILTGSNINGNKKTPGIRSYQVFLILWVLVFLLYLPVAEAGWVHDTVDWLKRIREEKFADYVNGFQALAPSLYHFTQLTTWVFYKLFHAHPWPWHLLFITLHAINGALLYTISNRLFHSSGMKNGHMVALGAVILFSICPHISEVIVWKASYHYLQGFLLLLAIVYWGQKYQYRQHAKYAWFAGITFTLSAFSLEIFYITPWLVLSLVSFYYYVLKTDRYVFKKSLLYLVMPMLLLFIGHLVLLHTMTGFFISHLGDEIKQPLPELLRKPPVRTFHDLFLGRFWPTYLRQHVQDFFASRKGIVLFYGSLAGICSCIIFYFKKMDQPAKAMALIFIWLLICLALVCPVWVSDIQYVIYDRYSYFMLPFIYLILCYFLLRVLPFREDVAFWILYVVINIFFTVKVNNYWKTSSHIVYNLSHNIPDPGNKIILLLNLPANMNGIQMIGSRPNSAFKQIYNVNNENKLTNQTYDVLSYNMISDTDGAHVAIYNDTLLHVTLNQWGTWWWYGRLGAISYQNEAFKLNLIDPGHWYELILKHPATDYLLLYQAGDHWKTVDVNKKNVDQY